MGGAGWRRLGAGSFSAFWGARRTGLVELGEVVAEIEDVPHRPLEALVGVGAEFLVAAHLPLEGPPHELLEPGRVHTLRVAADGLVSSLWLSHAPSSTSMCVEGTFARGTPVSSPSPAVGRTVVRVQRSGCRSHRNGPGSRPGPFPTIRFFSVAGRQPSAATETIGLAGGLSPSEPRNGWFEKLKMPPSWPTIR